jgi:pilus assembly protein Flp/PilA
MSLAPRNPSPCFLERYGQGGKPNKRRNIDMKQRLLGLKSQIWILLYDDGQDLIEYALVVALIAFAATVGMGNVANGINNAFSTISSKLASAIT